MPLYTKDEIAGFRTYAGQVLCPNCYHELVGDFLKGDEVITALEIEDGIAICDECEEPM